MTIDYSDPVTLSTEVLSVDHLNDVLVRTKVALVAKELAANVALQRFVVELVGDTEKEVIVKVTMAKKSVVDDKCVSIRIKNDIKHDIPLPNG